MKNMPETNDPPVTPPKTAAEATSIAIETNAIPRPEWLQVIYSEAWKQYCHEDNLYQNRSSIYLGINTALAATLALVVSRTEFSSVSLRHQSIPVGGIALSAGALFIAVMGVVIQKHWERLTNVCRAYLSLRLSTARLMEIEAGFENLTLVGLENRWLEWSNKQSDKSSWFSSGVIDPSTKAEYEIRQRPKLGGFQIQLSLIRTLLYMWYAVGSIAAAFFLGTVCAAVVGRV